MKLLTSVGSTFVQLVVIGICTAAAVTPAVAQTESSDSNSVNDGNFVVPAWFSSQPKPYEAPTQIWRSTPSPSTIDSGGPLYNNNYGGWGTPYAGWGGGYRAPFGIGGYGGWGGGIPGTGFGGLGGGIPGAGYGGWGGGIPGMGVSGFGGGIAGIGFGGWGGGMPGMGLGGWGGGTAGLGLGYWGGGRPGIGYGGYRGGWGGFGSGYGWGGWGGFGSPAAIGASMFAGGNSSFQGPQANRVIETAPSKPSGNYYAPSTVDTTASGSYYASDTPAITPVMRTHTTQRDDYWGSSGSSPFGKDVNNTVLPWNK